MTLAPTRALAASSQQRVRSTGWSHGPPVRGTQSNALRKVGRVCVTSSRRLLRPRAVEHGEKQKPVEVPLESLRARSNARRGFRWYTLSTCYSRREAVPSEASATSPRRHTNLAGEVCPGLGHCVSQRRWLPSGPLEAQPPAAAAARMPLDAGCPFRRPPLQALQFLRVDACRSCAVCAIADCVPLERTCAFADTIDGIAAPAVVDDAQSHSVFKSAVAVRGSPNTSPSSTRDAHKAVRTRAALLSCRAAPFFDVGAGHGHAGRVEFGDHRPMPRGATGFAVGETATTLYLHFDVWPPSHRSCTRRVGTVAVGVAVRHVVDADPAAVSEMRYRTSPHVRGHWQATVRIRIGTECWIGARAGR